MNVKKKNSLASLEAKINYAFRKKTLLRAALTHPSVSAKESDTAGNKYERLEFFGDAIINFLICEKLFEIFPEANEGILSRYRSTLVSRKILALIAQKISLHKFILIAYETEGFSREHPKLLADTLEALIGAMYLDRGIAPIRILVKTLWRPFLNQKKIFKVDPNPKSVLQEISQKHFKRLPIYEIKPAAAGFSASVYIQKRMKGKGSGVSKQEAAEEAAQELIQKLKKKKITLASGKATPAK